MPRKKIVIAEERRETPVPPAGAVYISASQVCQRYGGLTPMWLWRKLKSDSTFPRPTNLGRGKRNRYWKVDELVAWERSVAAKSRAA